MKLCEHRRNHVGFSHRVQGTGTADHKGVPGCDDTAHTADDDDFCHNRCTERFRHRICCDKSGSCFRAQDFGRVQHITDSQDNTGIENNSEYNGENHHFTDFL